MAASSTISVGSVPEGRGLSCRMGGAREEQDTSGGTDSGGTSETGQKAKGAECRVQTRMKTREKVKGKCRITWE